MGKQGCRRYRRIRSTLGRFLLYSPVSLDPSHNSTSQTSSKGQTNDPNFVAQEIPSLSLVRFSVLRPYFPP